MTETRKATNDVNTLTGDPKKAILAMMVPVTVALLIQSLNNIIDSVWVAGLGPNALAAVGVAFPLFFILIAIGNGIGIGASQAIARRIGAKDTNGADSAAVHGLILTIIGGAAVCVVLLLISPYLVGLIGGAGIESYCLAYTTPILIGTVPLLLSGYFSNILRSEGAAKRSMNIQILGAAINIVLDPIFIYVFGWGLGGAAWATTLSITIPLIFCVYWYKIRKSTYLKLAFKGFVFDKKYAKDIMSVGFPASMELFLISVISMIMNTIVLHAGGTETVAVYATGWRIINLLMIPLMAISSAIIPVCAACYGAKRMDRLNAAYWYALKLIIAIMLTITALAFIFAPQLAMLFTYSETTEGLREGIVELTRILVLFLPFMGLGFVSAGLFQSLGMGMKSLISTIVRNGLQIPICFFMSGLGVVFIWWGVVTAEILGSLFMGFWGVLVLRYMVKIKSQVRTESDTDE